MEQLLSHKSFTEDKSQIHLSEDQLSIGKYSTNLKGAISSFICAQLSQLIHNLQDIPSKIKSEDLIGLKLGED